jgi:hypothetical protein
MRTDMVLPSRSDELTIRMLFDRVRLSIDALMS